MMANVVEKMPGFWDAGYWVQVVKEILFCPTTQALSGVSLLLPTHYKLALLAVPSLQ